MKKKIVVIFYVFSPDGMSEERKAHRCRLVLIRIFISHLTLDEFSNHTLIFLHHPFGNND